LGLLYVNFKFIWEGAMGVLRLEAAHAPDDFWALFIDRVRHAAALTHTTRPTNGASRVILKHERSCCLSQPLSSLSCQVHLVIPPFGHPPISPDLVLMIS
jgi:hypothetical protein